MSPMPDTFLRKRYLLINYILFQFNWFACVMGAGQGWPWLGVFTVAGSCALHLSAFRGEFRQEASLLLGAAVVGLVLDTVLIQLQVLDFGPLLLAQGVSPPFMVALWVGFGMTLRHSMNWLLDRYLLGVVFGAVGGPLAYFAGEALGAVVLTQNTTYSVLAIGIAWGLALPLLLCCAAKLSSKTQSD